MRSLHEGDVKVCATDHCRELFAVQAKEFIRNQLLTNVWRITDHKVELRSQVREQEIFVLQPSRDQYVGSAFQDVPLHCVRVQRVPERLECRCIQLDRTNRIHEFGCVLATRRAPRSQETIDCGENKSPSPE